MPFEQNEYTLPAIWGSALINDDFSGLDDSDTNQLNKWLDDNKPGYCIDMSEDTDFRSFQGIGHQVARFTFHKH